MSKINSGTSEIFVSRYSGDYPSIFGANGNLELVSLEYAQDCVDELLFDSAVVKLLAAPVLEKLISCGSEITTEMYKSEMMDSSSGGYLEGAKRALIEKCIDDGRLSLIETSAGSWVDNFPGMSKNDHGLINSAFEKNKTILTQDLPMVAAATYLNLDYFYVLSEAQEEHLNRDGERIFLETFQKKIGRRIKNYEKIRNI